MNGKTASISSTPTLAIDFVIVGGGVAGLSCAYALQRTGHRVLVLEKDDGTEQTKVAGGCRLPPNMSKILFHWGFERKVREIAVTSGATFLSIYETGFLLGTHEWDEEVLKETGGQFVFCHHSDLRRMMREAAEALGARIRYNALVVSIDAENHSVTLASGEVIKGDVVIGADGPAGTCRDVITGGTDHGTPTGLTLYNTVVPGEKIRRDPELRYFLQQKHHTQFVWFGHGHCVLGYPIGGKEDFALNIYAPDDDGSRYGSWDEQAPASRLRQIMGKCEPRLQKLAKLAAPPARLHVVEEADLEDWVHDDGRLLLIGEAAHTLLPGSIQGSSMALEDAAVLAKLFSHLRGKDQIESFLYAFQDLRQKRCANVRAQEMGNLIFMCLPPGPQQQGRDQIMRQRYEAGQNVLGGGSDDGEEGVSEQWEEIKELFGYDAEDEADNWWVEWGLLRERAKERAADIEADVQDDKVIPWY